MLKKLKELEKTSDEDRSLETTKSPQDADKDGGREKKETERAGAEQRAARIAQVQMALELNKGAQGGDVRGLQ